ncbi:DAO domain-containing protein [Fusarium keratoplasticum]|nr:DAO domain-containing protein [Fusarium keratoplasticum]
MSQLTITTSIIGLAIASQLSRHHEITVIARDLPGDEPSIKWASPWAGANFVAGGCSSARERRMQMDAFTELWRLAIRHPESGVKRLPMEEFYDNERSDDDLWFKDFIPGLPPQRWATRRNMTIVLNPLIFMPWLKRNLESSGVKFRRMDLDSLSDADHLGHDVLINATGEGPKYLSDIKDQNMHLLRGQTMIIKSDYKKSFMRDDGKTYTYVIPRLDGTVILGGIRDPDIENTEVDTEIDQDIVTRVNRSLPEHFSADLADYEIVGHNVGIRPYRCSGMRIEKETKNGQNIVHAYGITGGGFIYSFGVGREVVKLVDEFLFPDGKARI